MPTRRRGRESRYKLPGARWSVTGPDYVAYGFLFLGSIIIYRLYKLTLSDQAKVTLQLSVSLCGLVLKFVADTSLLRGPKFFFFSPGPEPVLGGPAQTVRCHELSTRQGTKMFRFKRNLCFPCAEKKVVIKLSRCFLTPLFDTCQMFHIPPFQNRLSKQVYLYTHCICSVSCDVCY